MEEAGEHQMEARERFLESLKELFIASLRYSIGMDTQVETFREARRRVEVGWMGLEAAPACDPRAEDFREHVASVRARIGDNLFYDKGAADEAIAEYEAALALDPDCLEALKGIIAAYLQGSERRPAQALPYALRLAEFEPGRSRDIEYIRTLIAAQTARTE